MKTTTTLLATLGALLLGTASAQQPLSSSLGLWVYPSAGQTANVQAVDESECYTWAKGATGIDPQNPTAPPPAQVPQTSTGGAAMAGAFRGAVRGTVVADVTDHHDREEYQAAGAIMGAARGARAAQQRNAQAQQQAQQQQQQGMQQQITTFKNAFSACIEGRKYTVR
jgi:hypothetical protein